jgi:streptogramin lyase
MRSFIHCGISGVIALALTHTALASDVTGRVVDVAGKPVPFVRIRIGGQDQTRYSTSVFTVADGTFAAHGVNVAGAAPEIDTFRIGWKETGRKIVVADGHYDVSVTLHAVTNVADQVPASAWLGGDHDSLAYQMTMVQCSNCHQLGADRMRKVAMKMAGQTESARTEAWLHRSIEDLGPNANPKPWEQKSQDTDPKRAEAWAAIVQYMRYVTMRLGENNQLRWGLKEGSPYYNALLQPDTSLFAPRDMEIIVPNLARNFPVHFDTYTGYGDIERLGEYGPDKDTEIDEFVLPTFGWTREVAIAPGSKKVWFIETDKDRLGALDPQDGSVEWHKIPGDGQQGPHTMNADAGGNLWMACEDSFYIARYSTKTNEWRMYAPPGGTKFGVTHDFAFNSDRYLEPDPEGRIWITDLGKNELWGVNVDSGDIKTYRMPLAQGETNFHSLLYGAAYDSKRKQVWWAQLYGNVGSLDTDNNTAARIVPLSRGAGARRLAIQDGFLWVALSGASQILKINTDTGIEAGRYSLPDRGASPYGLTFDKKRNAIWVATSNSDRIYRLDIDTERWRQYPMPRKETFLRVIEVDHDTGDIWTTYASLPVGRRDPATFGTESANNIIVRLRPGS